MFVGYILGGVFLLAALTVYLRQSCAQASYASVAVNSSAPLADKYAAMPGPRLSRFFESLYIS